MSATSKSSASGSIHACSDQAVLNAIDQATEHRISDEVQMQSPTINDKTGVDLRKLFSPEAFYVTWDNSKVIMFRPKDLVDFTLHNKITIDSMSWDKFREQIEKRLNMDLRGKILQAIVDDGSGYNKPPIDVTDGAARRAVLSKFHYECNNECCFFITSPAGSTAEVPAAEVSPPGIPAVQKSRFGWNNGLYAFVILFAVLASYLGRSRLYEVSLRE